MDDLRKFSLSQGINGLVFDDYKKRMNSIISPSIVEERSLNAVTIDVFSALIRERIIFLGTAIDCDVSNIVTSQLMYLNSIDSDTDVKLFINSGGGDIVSGLAIKDVMDFINPDVSTYCMGMAASMASILLSSGTRGKRYALPNSRIMIHQASTYLGWVQTSDAKINYDEVKYLQDNLYKILSENTGKTFEEIEKDADRDHWLSPSESLPGVYGKFGLIDEIITKKK